MARSMRLLLLAGSGEGRELARALAVRPGLDLVVSLASAGRGGGLDGRLRTGGFGGRAGFEAFLEAERIGAVIDATHPFAGRITARTASVCAARGLPHLLLLRPAWRPGPGDRWTEIAAPEDAAAQIPAGATVFLATGRDTLPGFANLAGRHLICRQLEPTGQPFPYPNGRFLPGTPPFSVEDEAALFRELGVDVLVVKNAGGTASATKLTAARELGLPVLMIRRPAAPDCHRVETVAEALDWVAGLEVRV